MPDQLKAAVNYGGSVNRHPRVRQLAKLVQTDAGGVTDRERDAIQEEETGRVDAPSGARFEAASVQADEAGQIITLPTPSANMRVAPCPSPAPCARSMVAPLHELGLGGRSRWAALERSQLRQVEQRALSGGDQRDLAQREVAATTQ